MTVQKDVLDFFNVMVVNQNQKTDFKFSGEGFVLDFVPTKEQEKALCNKFRNLNIKTMFSPEEKENNSYFDLICKQLLHYVEVYGLNEPGLFDLEYDVGKLITVNYIKGITIEELNDRVLSILHANAPVKDVEALKNIIKHYNISFNINDVQNNELKVALFNNVSDFFDDGDDAVRYMCYQASGSTLLIKSREVIEQVKKHNFDSRFFENHAMCLAKVFNRHKRIILAAKNQKTKSAINKITRLSKKHHVPVYEGINKSFVAKALDGKVDYSVLDNSDLISVRDKLKFLNILAYKKKQLTVDAFHIRNGKVHVERNRRVYDHVNIQKVENEILKSLEKDMKHLKDKNIIMDENVDYGLPVSRKQTVGQLPFGTKVDVNSDKISSGIYWENAWGARDLDLSTVDINGNRTGWGSFSGFDRNNPVNFSGDVTDAHNGAMEFMVSSNHAYGLFVNIFSGNTGSQCEIVVGGKTEARRDKWIDDAIIREKTTLDSRGSVIGFVNDKQFVVYQGRLNNRKSNFGEGNPVINKALVDYWSVKNLFDLFGIEYNSIDKNQNTDYDLTYKQFSYDKLEEMFGIT